MRKSAAIFLLLLTVAFIYACAESGGMKRHMSPETSRICTACHEDYRASLSHTPDYFTRHGFYAGDRRTCSACHIDSFCADCHGRKEEIKPSDKYSDYPERSLPHRGDYLARHRIDGKVDPASCMRCHGRRSNEGCAACHR